MKTLPEYAEISQKVDKGEELDDLERFIYNQEPAGQKQCTEFRSLLLKAINLVDTDK